MDQQIPQNDATGEGGPTIEESSATAQPIEAQPIATQPAGAAQPVEMVPVAPRSRRTRWAFASVVVVAVLAATAAGAWVLSGASGSKSLTAGIAPKNAAFFMEVRTDLPGDQHSKLADFMSHFPGFKDRGQFDYALDELLNKITGEVSQDLRYTSAFKPWMEGEVSIAIMAPQSSLSPMPSACNMMYGPIATPIVVGSDGLLPPDLDGSLFSFDPNAEGIRADGMPESLSSFGLSGACEDYLSGLSSNEVAIVALKDRSAAEAWVAGEMTRAHLAPQAQTYAGATLYTTGTGFSQAAYTFTNQALVIGTVGGVKASLDTKTNGSLADNKNYQAAMKSATAESIARFYVDMGLYVRSTVASMNGMSCIFSTTPCKTQAPIAGLDKLPDWLAGSIRAESDRMVLEMSMANTGSARLGNHSSALASSLPGNTVGVFELHSIGSQINSSLDSLGSTGSMGSMSSMMGVGTSIKDIKDLLKRFGGVDWVGDGAAVITKTGDQFGGGVVIQATDPGTAKTKVDMLTNLVALSGSVTKATSKVETYKGVEITVVSVPSSSGTPAVEIAIGAKDNLIVAGYTDSFVKAVIDTSSSDSLAAQPDYSSAMGAAGNSNEESMYVNVPALEDLIGRSAMSATPSRWTQDYKPYFDHIGGVAYSVVDGDTVTMRLVVMAR